MRRSHLVHFKYLLKCYARNKYQKEHNRKFLYQVQTVESIIYFSWSLNILNCPENCNLWDLSASLFKIKFLFNILYKILKAQKSIQFGWPTSSLQRRKYWWSDCNFLPSRQLFNQQTYLVYQLISTCYVDKLVLFVWNCKLYLIVFDLVTLKLHLFIFVFSNIVSNSTTNLFNFKFLIMYIYFARN